MTGGDERILALLEQAKVLLREANELLDSANKVIDQLRAENGLLRKHLSRHGISSATGERPS